MLSFVREIFNGVADLIYPPFCCACGRGGDSHLCAKCVEEIRFIDLQHCLTCGTPTDKTTCPECEGREYAFERAASVGEYQGVLTKAIHAFKYDNRVALADKLAELMALGYANARFRERIDLVVPVPIHRSRLVERGFNQSEELAVRFCRLKRLPYRKDVLIKTQKTPHQVELSQDMRYSNVKGVFTAGNREVIRGKRILLIDDVFTTGSTLSESAQVLMDAGAAGVYAYTLARSV